MWEQAVDPSDALARLGRALLDEGYRFITPTPETHRRVLARGGAARTLRDVFGWSQPIAAERLPAQVRAIAEQAGVLLDSGGLVRSKVRFSSIGDMLFAHSSYPTVSADSVFFGPDTYRFAALCLSRLESPGHLADVGCGSGAGGLLLAGRARSVQLLDINPAALRFAASNAALNRVAVINNIPVAAQSWTHGSIAHRMRYLHHISGDPALTHHFDRGMARLFAILLISVCTFGTWGIVRSFSTDPAHPPANGISAPAQVPTVQSH